METLKKKYQNNSRYYRLVNLLMNHLIQEEGYTPLEIMECALLVCLLSEEKSIAQEHKKEFPQVPQRYGWRAGGNSQLLDTIRAKL